MLYVFIFLLIPISLQFDCEPGYVLYNNNCVPCSDSNCLVCSSVLPHSCYECTPSFTLYERQCAVSDCKKIKHCSLCNNNECLKCSGICILDNGKCNCTEKIVIIIVCILIGVLALGVVIYCLVKPSRIRNTAIINIVNMRQETINEQREFIKIKHANENMDLEDYDDLFEKSKFVIGKNIENKKCDLCKKQQCNLKLSCGCFICNEDDKKLLLDKSKGKICPLCKKEVTDVTPTTCGICFQNKSELCKFRCGCAMVVCKQCFITWKKSKQICPACREII